MIVPSIPSIKLVDSPEPISPRGQHGEISLFPQPPSYGLILHELNRYVEGWTGGRSILVAGHRGSGKTTLVHMAIQELNRRYRELRQPYHLLLVELYGPALYVDGETPKPIATASPLYIDVKTSKPTETASTPGNREAVRSKQLTERALTEITSSLYRSLATHMAGLFRDRINEGDFGLQRADLLELATRMSIQDLKAHQRGGSVTSQQRVGLLELAAQLSMDMDTAPSASVLREYWARAGLLETGVLFNWAQQTQLPWQDQGMRELVALSTAALDYRIVAGLRQSTEGRQATSQQEEAASLALSSQNSKEIINALFGLASAVLVGAGAQAALGKPLIAAIAAVLAGLTTLVALNYSASRSEKQVETQEETFVRKYSLESLSRELPLLLQRLSDARIAPVFVVDELDKVPEWDRDPGELLTQLKYFVTERSFFFFLADRTTYDVLESRSTKKAYPQQHTFFTHRIFMLHRPSDLHRYLLSLMGAGPSNFSRELALLPYYLLHDARLHPFDLNQELGRLIGLSGQLEIPEDFPSAYRFRFRILIQLAVEWLLRQPEQAAVIERKPRWGQVIYHTLYYPSFCWSKGTSDLVLKRETLDAHLTKWLEERVDTETGLEDTLDPDYLLDLVWKLVDWLCRPVELAQELQRSLPTDNREWPAQVAQVLEYLRGVENLPSWQLLNTREKVDAGTGQQMRLWQLAWRFDQFGRPTEAVVAEETEITEIQEFVSQVGDAIGRVTVQVFDLARLAEVGILPPTPGKTAYDNALSRLLAWLHNGQDYPDRTSDLHLLTEYRDIIRTWAGVTGRALALGTAAGVAAGQSDPSALESGVRALVDVLGLRQKNRADTAVLLRAVENSLRSRSTQFEDFEIASAPDAVGESGTGSDIAADVALALEPGHVDNWEAAVKKLLDELKKPDKEPAAWPATWWERWRQRMAGFFSQDTTSFPPYWSDVIARAAGKPAGAQLDLDLKRITMGAWSEILLLALRTAVQDRVQSAAVAWNDLLLPALEAAVTPWPSPSMPVGWDATAPWLAIAAVDRLGLGQQVEQSWKMLADKIASVDESPTLAWVKTAADSKRWREHRAIGYVVAAPGNSITKGWPAPARYGGILLDRSRWLEISESPVPEASRKAAAAKDVPAQCVVLVEPGDAEPDENQLESTLRLVEVISGSRPAWLFIVPATAPETRTDRLVIRNPENFDDAMDRALRALPSA